MRGKKDEGAAEIRYPIALVEQAATVTIEFASFRPGVAQIMAALEEALAMERARLESV